MNIIKCVNGHFFDGDIYSSCPECGSSSDNVRLSVVENSKKRLFETKNRTDVSGSSSHQNISISGAGNPSAGKSAYGKACEQEAPATEFSPQGAVFQKKPLAEQVKQVSAYSAEKTVSYFNAVSGESIPAGPKGNALPPVTPVAGWLVCIAGMHIGESFCIAAGINSIGRNAGNRIVLQKDLSVSRDRHAYIVYEPKTRRFFIKPGESTGLTYLNDEYIAESKILSKMDVIELGNSRLMFVPLCGPDFSWEG